jgi:hypothetical protein
VGNRCKKERARMKRNKKSSNAEGEIREIDEIVTMLNLLILKLLTRQRHLTDHQKLRVMK